MKSKFKNLNTNNGFSLVELIVVIAIIIVLLSLLIPNVVGYIEKANNAADVANAKTMANYLQLGVAMSNDPSFNYTATPWAGEANENKGYIYVDDDEIRTSSIVIAKVLEENGILKPGSTINPEKRGDEPIFKKDKASCFCQSSKTWDRYQINFVGKGRSLSFTYTASRNGREKDEVATKTFAHMIGGKPSGDDITLGPAY